MVESPCRGLAGRMAPARAHAVCDTHPLRWTVLERHPVAIAVLTVVAMMALLQLDKVFTTANVYEQSAYGTLLRAVLCAVTVWGVARAGLLKAIGLTGPPLWRAAWLWWLPVVMVAVMVVLQLAAVGLTDDGLWLGLSAVDVFFVGFLEELVVRGVVLFLLVYAWRERTFGVVAAVLASSALFGAAHIVNSAFGGSAPWSATLPQVGYAFLIGVGISALVLRTNTLWSAIVWHAAFDFVGIGFAGPPADTGGDQAMETAPDTGSPVGQMLPFVVLFVYGLVLVRRRKAAPSPA